MCGRTGRISSGFTGISWRPIVSSSAANCLSNAPERQSSETILSRNLARSSSSFRSAPDKRERLVINHFSAGGVRQVMAYPIGLQRHAPGAPATKWRYLAERGGGRTHGSTNLSGTNSDSRRLALERAARKGESHGWDSQSLTPRHRAADWSRVPARHVLRIRQRKGRN